MAQQHAIGGGVADLLQGVLVLQYLVVDQIQLAHRRLGRLVGVDGFADEPLDGSSESLQDRAELDGAAHRSEIGVKIGHRDLLQAVYAMFTDLRGAIRGYQGSGIGSRTNGSRVLASSLASTKRSNRVRTSA